MLSPEPVQDERHARQARLAQLLGNLVPALPRRDARTEGNPGDFRRRSPVLARRRSCDEAAEAPAKYTKENALVWTQVYGGKILEGVAETYLIRAIPATFLIAPDGRVLAMNLRGPALKEAVRNALNDQKLFPTAR